MKASAIGALIFALSLSGCVTRITAETVTITTSAETALRITPLP